MSSGVVNFCSKCGNFHLNTPYKNDMSSCIDLYIKSLQTESSQSNLAKYIDSYAYYQKSKEDVFCRKYRKIDFGISYTDDTSRYAGLATNANVLRFNLSSTYPTSNGSNFWNHNKLYSNDDTFPDVSGLSMLKNQSNDSNFWGHNKLYSNDDTFPDVSGLSMLKNQSYTGVNKTDNPFFKTNYLENLISDSKVACEPGITRTRIEEKKLSSKLNTCKTSSIENSVIENEKITKLLFEFMKERKVMININFFSHNKFSKVSKIIKIEGKDDSCRSDGSFIGKVLKEIKNFTVVIFFKKIDLAYQYLKIKFSPWFFPHLATYLDKLITLNQIISTIG